MLSLNDAMLKKRQEPAFSAPWDTLEPAEQSSVPSLKGARKTI